MKKVYKGIVLCSLPVLLVACAGKKESETKKQTETKVTRTTTSQTSSTTTTMTSQTETTVTTEVTTAETTSVPVQNTMNVEQVLAGDFSSVAGTWQNEYGMTMFFDQQGVVGALRTQVDIENSREGMLVIQVKEQSGLGFAISFIPGGVIAPDDNYGGVDSSDKSRDRMVAGHQYHVSDPRGFFYKID
ncbi:DUF6287 domain-containing protein [Streptococcus hillyeri]|uniref:DUF6287 domain-containing protein n=1 Tax=Streptococcus hillyeri TaxID=2282420 RepID=UPI0034E23C2A